MKQYAQGAAQSMLSSLADFIAPTVNVGSSVGRHKVYTEKNRFHIPDTKRSVGGPANILTFSQTDAYYNCEPHALDYPVDYLEQLEAAPLENMIREGAVSVAEVAALSHEKRVLDLALAADASPTDSDFTSSSVDPVAIIDSAIEDVLKATKAGSFMNIRIALGVTAMRLLKNNPVIRSRVFSGAKNPKEPVTIEQLSALFLGTPQFKLSMLVEDTAPEGLDENLQFLMSNSILVFAASNTPTRRDPSFMKTFRLMGQWMTPRSYQSTDGRQEIAGFDWSEDVQVTNTAAIKRINANES